MGTAGSQYFGWPAAPVKVSDSVEGLLKQVRAPFSVKIC